MQWDYHHSQWKLTDEEKCVRVCESDRKRGGRQKVRFPMVSGWRKSGSHTHAVKDRQCERGGGCSEKQTAGLTLSKGLLPRRLEADRGWLAWLRLMGVGVPRGAFSFRGAWRAGEEEGSSGTTFQLTAKLLMGNS